MTMAGNCPNASNPYHDCGKFCSQRSSRSKNLAVDGNLAPKEVGVEKNGGMVGGRRNVDPLCGYASNPYHKCTDLCSRRNPNQKNSPHAAKSGIAATVITKRSSRGVGVTERKNVDPKCNYASNPYHKCTSHCSMKINKVA